MSQWVADVAASSSRLPAQGTIVRESRQAIALAMAILFTF